MADAVGDRIDDLLDPACTDVHAMATLLAECERNGVAHPGLQSLSLKSASIRVKAAPPALALQESSEEEEDEEEDGLDTLSPLQRPQQPPQRSSRSSRRVAPAPAEEDARGASPSSSARRGSIAAAAAHMLSGTGGGPLGRRGSVLKLPGAAGGRRASLSPSLAAGRRGSVLLPPRSLLPSLGASSPGGSGAGNYEHGATAAAPSAVQVAGPAGRRQSVSVQMESLEALFEEDKEGEMKSEWRLVFSLAVPLVLSNLADEISNVGLIALWGRLGTTALAAGNLCDSWMELALVVVYGFQQAMYSMVPQAAGAGNAKQVSNMLTMSVMWTCVILLLPVGVVYWFFGRFINVPESADGYGYGYGYGAADAAGNVSGCGGEILPLLETATAAIGQQPQVPVSLEAELAEAELNETLTLFLTDPLGDEDNEAAGAEVDCDLQCTVTSYTRACILYLLPYILVETLRCWLGSLEIVTILAPNAGFWALTRVPLYALLMFPFDLGLNGYAYGMMISTAGELLGTYLIVVLWKKPHLQWWNGVDWTGASEGALNWRFVKLGGAASVQLFASFASSAVLYSLMATRSEVHLAAYGVLQGFTHMGSSLSHALFTATSICVGTRLGGADPVRSKQAALAGVVYNVILGLGLASVMLAYPEGLSLLLVPNDEDAPTRKVVVDAIVPTAMYCILQALQWGFWSVLEGCARVSITSVFIIIGWWVVAVPGSFLALHLNSLEPCSIDADGADVESGNPSTEMALIMWCQCAGFLVCDLLMASCIIFGDWQALSDEAVANAQEDEEDAAKATSQDGDGKKGKLKNVEEAEGLAGAKSPPDSPDSSPDSSPDKSHQDPIINNKTNSSSHHSPPPKDNMYVPGAIPPSTPQPGASAANHMSAEGVTERPETVATAMIVLDEWLERWNALDEKVWTDSVLFNPKRVNVDRVRTSNSNDDQSESLLPPQQQKDQHQQQEEKEADGNLRVFTLKKSSSFEIPLLPADDGDGSGNNRDGSSGDGGGGGDGRSYASKKFAQMLKPLKAMGWHHSQWQRREVLIDDEQPHKVKLDTICLRYSEDNQLLGEFASEYEVERVDHSESGGGGGGGEAELWKVKFLGMNDLQLSDDEEEEDEDEEDEDDRAEVCDEDLQRQPQEREQSEHGADAGAKRLLP